MSQFQRPRQVSAYAQACLDALGASGHGLRISLGGAFGLAHYFEYRTTHDVDAWWIEPLSQEERKEIIRILEDALRAFGEVRTRVWGDVVSVELRQQEKTVFSFQIARRSAGLQEPVPSPWPGGIRVDSLDDLVAAKMAALVERGAPRDFRDIYMLCQRGEFTPARCWELWQERQQRAGEDFDLQRAVIAIETHLARFEQARPLENIADAEQRTAAKHLRTWFRTEFSL